MTDAAHQIRRQRYELQLADVALRGPAEAALRQGRKDIERALLAVLEQLDRPGQVVRLGRVELDLGVVSSADLRQVLRERLPRLLRQQLQPRIAGLEPGGDGFRGPSAPLAVIDGDQRSDLAGDALAALLVYLASGRRPWWARNLQWRRLLAAIGAASTEPGGLVALLWRSLSSPDHRVLARMAGPGAWPAVAPHLPSPLLQRLEQRSVGIDGEVWAGRLLSLAVVLVDSGEALASMAAMLSPALGDEVLHDWLNTSDVDAVVPPTARALLQAAAMPIGCPPVPLALPEPLLAARLHAAVDAAVDQGIDSATLGPAGTSAEPGERSGVELLTPVAGLVLLHPFLPALMQELGLLAPTQSRFVAGGQRRAVALLHYLGWGWCGANQGCGPDGAGGADEGRDQAAARSLDEPELVLEKLLVGLSPSLPWWPLRLSDAERVEADRLLAAVVSHWQALKSTSADGLRQGFLQRDGQLVGGTGGWRLRVARQDIDVLMERLPWSFSAVRLAWMPQPLMVDW